MGGDELADGVRQAIAKLPERERLALHAFYLQDRSAAEARKIMDLSLSGFYRLLERASEHLAVVLQREAESRE